MKLHKLLSILSISITLSASVSANEAKLYQVEQLKVTTLSTMLANRGIGEWGYAALIEVDGRKILFDTGNRPQTVLQNVKDLNVDLSDVEDVILSHNHGDHTGGLETLRAHYQKLNPKALSHVHVGKGIFAKRVGRANRMLAMKSALENQGVVFSEYANVKEIYPGVWLTGNVARVHPERNWGGRGRIETSDGQIEDNIPEDMSLVINTKDGLVLVAGCGHAGIINTMEHIVKHISPHKITTAIGGFHLVNAEDQHLAWTANKLKHFGLQNLMGAHCTGINSVFALRELLQSNREQVVVGSVGDSFSLSEGVKPGGIAR
ncbi:MBL fold metallo-hydrolase [Thalassotalea piscium]|uniref:7, 8-dihydropterin-6-yl-methyl-4-(Beta-D-ribofuranosyl)aminobenzene 5'-phosphate synthase n=1 Tax=Thalassotalea piscium TaxID=1230533 RepID=A0A7X0NIP7_9GAMM|nr:MBL fold metallo-hydrolase [Thalassotalea piscium]MBB6544192.1 7,8-dihydropterin-6-yl-methyl-4-(beta-D-ribofuranosyl)aminobenzene 5'-phosphate synthase [Thalassotalea piscium]